MIFKHFSGSYGWTPKQIGDLTLPQVWIYLEESDGDPGVKPLTGRKLRQMELQIMKEKEKHGI